MFAAFHNQSPLITMVADKFPKDNKLCSSTSSKGFSLRKWCKRKPWERVVCSQIYRDIIQNFCSHVKSYCLCLDHRRSCEEVSSRGIYQLNFDSNKFKVSSKVKPCEPSLNSILLSDMVPTVDYGAHFKLGLLEKAFVGNFCLLFIYLFIYLFIIIYSSVSIHFVYYFLFGKSLFITTRLAIIHK